MKFRDVERIYKVNDGKEETASDAVSSSASSGGSRLTFAEMGKARERFDAARAGELRRELTDFSAQYDALADAYNNQTKTDDQLRRDWEALRPMGEELSEKLSSSGLFDEESIRGVKDSLGKMISSFSDAVAVPTIPEYDIGSVGMLDELGNREDARSAAARALAAGAIGDEAEAAREVLRKTDAPEAIQVGTHRVTVGKNERDKLIVPQPVRGLSKAEETLLEARAEDSDIPVGKSRNPVKNAVEKADKATERAFAFNDRVAEVGDLVMDSAALGMERALSNIGDFAVSAYKGAKNAIVSPSAPELKGYSVPSEENPVGDTRKLTGDLVKDAKSISDKFVKGQSGYLSSGNTFGDRTERGVLATTTSAQREAMNLNAVERVAADLAETIGYQLPNMVLTGATGASGIAANLMTVGTFGTGAYAEQKREALKAGYTEAEAELLARAGFVIEGVGETLLGDAFGTVPMLGRKLGFSIMSNVQNPIVRTMLSFMTESAEEGLEEVTQSFLSEAAHSLITGEDFKLDLEQVAYEGLLGALSGGLMGSVGLGQRIEGAEKVHAADVDYINSLSVNAEAVSSAEEAREMIRALEKQRAALVQVEDSQSGIEDAADRAVYMDSMIRKIEVMLSEKYSLDEVITDESGFERDKGNLFTNMKRAPLEGVSFQRSDDNAVIAIESRAAAVKDEAEARTVIDAIGGIREANTLRGDMDATTVRESERMNERLSTIEEDLRARFGIEAPAEVSNDTEANTVTAESEGNLGTVDTVATEEPAPIEDELELARAARDYVYDNTAAANETYNSAQLAGANPEQRAVAIELGQLFNKRVLFFSDPDRNVGGYYEPSENAIYVNANSPRATYSIIASEMTHALEKTPEYSAIKEISLRQLAKRTGTSLDVLRAKKREVYEARTGKQLSEEYVDQELVEEYIGKYLFKDAGEIQSFVSTDPKSANRFIQFLDGVIKAITRNNAVAKWIRKKLGDTRVLWVDALNRVKSKGAQSGETINENKRHSYDNNRAFRTPVVISDSSELAQKIAASNKSKYDVIREYIIENFYGYEFTLSDGKVAIIDKSDAKELSHKATTKKAAEIANIAQLIESATLEAQELNVEHRKFDQFFYYIAEAEYKGELFDVVLNVGHGKTDKKYHIYELTDKNKNRRSADRINGLSGSVDNRITNASPGTSISQDDPRVNTDYTQNSEKDSSDRRFSFEGVDEFDENRVEESQEREEDLAITERMRQNIETEGKKAKDKENPYSEKEPISVDEYLRGKNNIRRGFVSMADQAESGEVKPPEPGTAAAVGEAAAKELLPPEATPKEIAKASERLAKEAEAIKEAISREVKNSELLFPGSDEERILALRQVTDLIAKNVQKNDISAPMQVLAQDIADGKRDVTHIPSGFDRDSVLLLAQMYSVQHSLMNRLPENAALMRLGLKVESPLVVDYRSAPALRGLERIRKDSKREVEYSMKDMSALERNAAELIAAGEADIADYAAADIDKYRVVRAADAIRTFRAYEQTGVSAQRAETVSRFEAVLEDLVKSPQAATRKSALSLNLNTMVRNNLDVFGEVVGGRVNELLFRPIMRNEAERMRFVNRENEDFRRAFGKVTEQESEFAQMFIEAGIGISEVANEDVEELVRRIEKVKTDLEVDFDEYRRSLEGKSLSKDERKFLAQRKGEIDEISEKYNALAAAVKSGIDITRLANMSDFFRAKYDLYYEAINDFLVIHGYEPIGFIKNYAPHMQEENMEKFSSILQRLGFQEGVFELPVEIAGRTEHFKPGKKYNPHFKTRHGIATRLDALAGFDSYVRHLSEVLYHTDDIQKLRQFNQYLRTAMAEETIKDQVSAVRKKMRSGELSDEDGNNQIDAILEKVKNTNLSPYVALLDNYTNVIAGKQTVGDRASENDFGRRSLNLSTKLRQIFVQSSIVGNFSSAINQTVQLPLVAVECGEGNLAAALTDVIKGDLNKTMDFDKRSTFITGKRGVTVLTMPSAWEKATDIGMIPFESVDDVISRVIVRAKYFQLIKSGVNEDTALVLADEYADSAIGSRIKGAKPMMFHNKSFMKALLTTFQLEIANGWAHIGKDLPREIKKIERDKGRNAAVKFTASLILRYLVEAFLLNGLLDELYGQTPVQFDVIGYIVDGISAGYGLTRRGFIESLFTKALKGKEFNALDAVTGSGKEVMEDVPFLQTALALLGYADSRLPLPSIQTSKILKGAGNIFSDEKDVREKGRAQLGDGIWSTAKSFLPFGNQLNKFNKGLEAWIKGGSYDYSGRLQYAVGDDALSGIPALIFGTQAYNESNEFWAAGGQALSEKATSAYEELRDSGMKFDEAYSLAKEMSALKGDEKPERDVDVTGMDPFEAMSALYFTDYSGDEDEDLQTKVQKQVELLDSVSGLTDEQKYIAFRNLCADSKAATMMQYLAEHGVDYGEAYDVISSLAITKNTKDDPRAREKFLRESDLTGWEKSYVYYNMLASKSERETVEALRDLNEAEPVIYEVLDDISIEGSKGGDGVTERKRAIVMNSDLSDDGKLEMYSRMFVSDSESGKKEQALMDELVKAGVDAGEVAEVFSGIKDEATDAGKANVLIESSLTNVEVEKVYLQRIVTEPNRKKAQEKLDTVIDAGGNVRIYLKAYAAVSALSWENGDWEKGESGGKSLAYKAAIDKVTSKAAIRRALYKAFDVSEKVW